MKELNKIQLIILILTTKQSKFNYHPDIALIPENELQFLHQNTNISNLKAGSKNLHPCDTEQKVSQKGNLFVFMADSIHIRESKLFREYG